MFKGTFTLLRPKQYIKNLFVFLPLLFSGKFLEAALWWDAISAFVLFSLAASSIYIINDIRDVDQDRLHPVKKFRPIPNGDVPVSVAIYISVILIIISLSFSLLLSANIAVYIGAYILLNLAYSFQLKHIPILDLSCIAIGFVLRVITGAAAIEVPASMWIILMTFLLAIFLGLGKRRDDLLLLSDGVVARKNLDGYNLTFINLGMTIMAAVVIVSYIMYSISDEVQNQIESDWLYVSSFFVVLGILRYMQRTFVEDDSGDPTSALYSDPFLQMCVLGWGLVIIIIFLL